MYWDCDSSFLNFLRFCNFVSTMAWIIAICFIACPCSGRLAAMLRVCLNPQQNKTNQRLSLFPHAQPKNFYLLSIYVVTMIGFCSTVEDLGDHDVIHGIYDIWFVHFINDDLFTDYENELVSVSLKICLRRFWKATRAGRLLRLWPNNMSGGVKQQAFSFFECLLSSAILTGWQKAGAGSPLQRRELLSREASLQLL